MARLMSILEAKALSVAAIVDHSGDAAKVGLSMPPTKLVIFQNPKAGTPLMLAAPSIAIDLPLKVLLSEGDDSKVWVTYNSPEYLQARHNFPPDLLKNIAAIKAICEETVR
ncbi:DUF302 domain-containing protein [Granulicella sp. S190]|uniref:DUF302 domain-containing protein n=1 Tax=Granulicella sp. S190 TaxID=1747226 RepID=UPI0020B13776|nr:DUF302 domain-containing protein [Granulicella sp. S190]